MLGAIILPNFRSTRLCVTACGIMHPRCCRPATSWMHYTTRCNTQSSAPEDEPNNCPKYVELTGIINKPLLLHLFGCLYYLYFIIFFETCYRQSQFIPLQNVVYFITLLFWFVKYSHFTQMMSYYLNVHFQGQRVNLGSRRMWGTIFTSRLLYPIWRTHNPWNRSRDVSEKKKYFCLLPQFESNM